MKVIVDTSVWSLALRRRQGSLAPETVLLKDLIYDGRVVLLGMVRQELLSGIRSKEQFESLKQQMSVFPDLALQSEDHELAAEFYNVCVSKGIAPAHIDLLLCAVAHRRDFEILTTDPDFGHYRLHLPVRLLTPG